MPENDDNSGSWKSGLSKIEPSPEVPSAEGVYTLEETSGLSSVDLAQPLDVENREISALRPQVENIARQKDGQQISSDQAEVLKKYISLKEAEVRDLREQRRQFQNLLAKLSTQTSELGKTNKSLATDLDATRRRLEKAEEAQQRLEKKSQAELETQKNDYEERLSKVASYEGQMQEMARHKEVWKEKVAQDLKRIKLKERELENKYELLKRDTSALLESKDKHVLELKKKNDALELELESLEERLRQRSNAIANVDAKKRRLVETLRLAISLLEEIDQDTGDPEGSSPARKAG